MSAINVVLEQITNIARGQRSSEAILSCMPNYYLYTIENSTNLTVFSTDYLGLHLLRVLDKALDISALDLIRHQTASPRQTKDVLYGDVAATYGEEMKNKGQKVIEIECMSCNSNTILDIDHRNIIKK